MSTHTQVSNNILFILFLGGIYFSHILKFQIIYYLYYFRRYIFEYTYSSWKEQGRDRSSSTRT